ncbi:M15 family metallopeptidase [Aerococcaceae bacterium DSM 111021]|nr:M15 family metallopeptidase [Aerococcaceae bacterium DSM 111021]
MTNRTKLRYFLVTMIVLLTVPMQSIGALEVIDTQLIEPFKSDLTVEELVEALPEDASIDEPNLMLINRDNRLEADLEMEFAWTGTGNSYNANIVDPFNSLITAAEEAGYYFETVSAYRTMAFQEANFAGRYNMYLAEGYSEADAFYMTDMFVAPADATEHSTGLAFDLLGTDWQEYGRDLHQAYGQYGSAIWLAENGHEHGFILRYLEGKTHITGYEYEPWHIRYVGKDHATFMFEHGLTLEEYIALINLKETTTE